MHVLFVAHAYPRFTGDVPGSFLHRLAVALRDRDVRVTVLAPSAEGLAPQETLEGIEVRRWRYAPSRHETLAYTGNMIADATGSIGGAVALLGLLNRGSAAVRTLRAQLRPDVVHAHWWFPGGFIASRGGAGRQVGRARTPLVVTLHGSDVRVAARGPVARRLFRGVTRKAHAVTTVSSWLAAKAVEAAPGLSPVIAPMPVEPSLFTAGPPHRNGRLLFVGRLGTQKGVHHLLNALALMKRPASLDVVGDGPERDALRRQAEVRKLSDRVRWLGALPQEHVAPLMREASALVVPSCEEGLGLVAVEAAFSETPVIAFASGGLPDVVRDGRTGRLVPVNDAPALALALDEVLADPELARRWGTAGRAEVLARFAPTAAAERYLTLYREAVGPRAYPRSDAPRRAS